MNQARTRGASLGYDGKMDVSKYKTVGEWYRDVRGRVPIQMAAGLEKVMKDMQTLEAALMRSEEMARTGNHAGAWESLERAWAEFPDDAKLNQQRADMTTRASDFVKVIRSAEELEKRDQIGSSLALYLKAEKIYPASDFARDGVARLVKLVLPDE